MDFYEHTLLSYPDLTLVLLKTAARGETTLQACLAELRRMLAQADEAPDVETDEILRHLAHAQRNLMRALLLAPVDSDRFRITDRGRQALAEHPMGIDDTVLMQFPEFRAFIERAGRRPSIGPATAPAYADGYRAFRAGRGLAENPHPFETVEHLAWENGWFQARDEDIDRPRR